MHLFKCTKYLWKDSQRVSNIGCLWGREKWKRHTWNLAIKMPIFLVKYICDNPVSSSLVVCSPLLFWVPSSFSAPGNFSFFQTLNFFPVCVIFFFHQECLCIQNKRGIKSSFVHPLTRSLNLPHRDAYFVVDRSQCVSFRVQNFDVTLPSALLLLIWS